MNEKDFSALFGNRATANRLAANVREGELPHALLITGQAGSGRHTLAKEIAAAMNCEKRDLPGQAIPCRTCNVCRRILADNHPDVKTLAKTPGKATIGVDELRLFREDMFLSATEAGSKFYIIETADDMTPQAQNALLKVLEEPPTGVHILLLASGTAKILSTVRSRAQLIRMERFSPEEIEAALTGDPKAAEKIAPLGARRAEELYLAADGRIGRALALADEKSLEEIERDRKLVLDLLAALPKRESYAKLYEAVSALPQKRDEIREILELALDAVHDLLLSEMGEESTALFFLPGEGETKEALSGIGEERLHKTYRLLLEAIGNIDRNVIVSSVTASLATRLKLN